MGVSRHADLRRRARRRIPSRADDRCCGLVVGLLDSGWVHRLTYSAVIVVAVLTGCASSGSTSSASNPFGDAITAQQYASLKLGQDEQTIVDELQESGKRRTLSRTGS